jgi:5-methylthioadenosine/S-adenosylhomocysteine deaminase
MCDLCRRNFMRGFAAFGAASAIPSPLLAQVQSVPRPPGDIRTPALPPRGELVLRNAHVMTMDSALGDIPGGSVHVRNGEIIAVGRDVDAPGAQVIAGDT